MNNFISTWKGHRSTPKQAQPKNLN